MDGPRGPQWHLDPLFGAICGHFESFLTLWGPSGQSPRHGRAFAHAGGGGKAHGGEGGYLTKKLGGAATYVRPPFGAIFGNFETFWMGARSPMPGGKALGGRSGRPPEGKALDP